MPSSQPSRRLTSRLQLPQPRRHLNRTPLSLPLQIGDPLLAPGDRGLQLRGGRLKLPLGFCGGCLAPLARLFGGRRRQRGGLLGRLELALELGSTRAVLLRLRP
jgi:hypothetical protein